LFFDEKDKLIQTLKEKVQKLQVQNNEKDLIIKSQEEEIRRLKEEVDSLIKKTTFEWKSSSLSEPPLTMTITNTKFDEDSDDMVPKL
jgi:predicted RNase H-like nuclease (RuvC/YqgF family)